MLKTNGSINEVESRANVVVGIQHPYNAMLTSFAAGRTIPASPKADQDSVQYWSVDTAFVVDQLTKLATGPGQFARRLDLSRLGIFGRSFGGEAAAEFCLDDARCFAGLDGSLSGDVEKTGVTEPFMPVLSDTDCDDVTATGIMTLETCRPVLNQFRPPGRDCSKPPHSPAKCRSRGRRRAPWPVASLV